MVCITNCAFGTALVGGTIATALISKQDSVFKEYRNSLNTEQLEALERISNYRLSLYIQGTILGIIIVLLIGMFGGKHMSPFTCGCTFAVVVLLTQYFYYMLMPKPDWMIRHLRTQHQNEKWLRVYRHMSFRWHIGLLIGLIGFFFIGRGVAF
jgi:archaellum biogenesis protein FlaJ (TadC family)